MKRIKIILLSFTVVLLGACSNSLDRADRTIGLIQENVTGIIGKISEVQNIESDLQSDFEQTLSASQDLSAFNQEDNLVGKNIAKRKELIQGIVEHSKLLKEYVKELKEIPDHPKIPHDQVNKVIEYVDQLTLDIDTYTSNYLQNLDIEKDTFQSIGNPKLNSDLFFQVFNNINLLSTENNMNLDKAVGQFERLNTLLVNLKVYLVNITGK